MIFSDVTFPGIVAVAACMEGIIEESVLSPFRPVNNCLTPPDNTAIAALRKQYNTEQLLALTAGA
ncbi:MAG: hypothetical protein NVSMB27_16910 [Ktedonobacteraceae bacterium]